MGLSIKSVTVIGDYLVTGDYTLTPSCQHLICNDKP
jgi:hypothetical protein